MNGHLQKAIERYASEGTDFGRMLNWHLCHGVVVCNSDAFAIGFHADSTRDFEPAQYEHSDTLFVVWCSGDMLAALLPFVDRYEKIAWQRSFKNSPRVRSYDMAGVFEKLNR